MIPFRIFIGYDPRQPVAAHVLLHSVVTQATAPAAITFLKLDQLPITRSGLTDFTFSRFLVPSLCDFEGLALFLDSDMLARADLAELLAYPIAFPEHDVFVVNHAKRFERPSLMLFQNARCKTLTPAFVENPENRLFDFAWASSVGALPPAWNHLVGYDAHDPQTKIAHFTQGIPIWPETEHSEFAEEWRRAEYQMRCSVGFEALMGPSVHAAHLRHRQPLDHAEASQ